ncbi:uncharacterized protein [Antedon mediterranea]|uniref:uncharacterized protein n=1 Tax=Antedon mediterranea TaxID=105859 RepID=UPI003AF6940A
MIRFGFICERTTSTSQASMESTSIERSFFVPLRLAFETSPSSEVKSVHDGLSISIYYDLCGHLPDILFPYLVIDFIKKYQKETGDDPKLSNDYAELYVDQYHNVILSLVKLVTKQDDHKFLLKATIKVRKALGETITTTECEPSPSTCKQVVSTIEMSFKHSKDGGRRGIKFHRCIPCDCSKTSEKKHMQILGDFQDEMLPCHGSNMNVKRYKQLFGNTGTSNVDRPTAAALVTSKLSGEISEDNYRELLSKVSSWFKESEKVNLLKVILCKCEHISVVEIERSNDPFELFKLLEGPGIISQSNIDVLIEIIAIGGMKGVYESIKHLIPTFAGFEKLIISERWNDVRKVIRFGLKISNADKVKIGQLRGLKVKESDDVWILIFKLVMKETFTKKRTEFVRLLKDNDMDSLATLLE